MNSSCVQVCLCIDSPLKSIYSPGWLVMGYMNTCVLPVELSCNKLYWIKHVELILFFFGFGLFLFADCDTFLQFINQRHLLLKREMCQSTPHWARQLWSEYCFCFFLFCIYRKQSSNVKHLSQCIQFQIWFVFFRNSGSWQSRSVSLWHGNRLSVPSRRTAKSSSIFWQHQSSVKMVSAVTKSPNLSYIGCPRMCCTGEEESWGTTVIETSAPLSPQSIYLLHFISTMKTPFYC